VGVGNYDGTIGDDIVVSTLWSGEVHYLSGREHSGTPGFDALDESDLGLRDGVDGPTDGLPVSTGMAGPQYGIALGALGNFYDPPSGAVDSGRLDFAASGFNTNDLFVVPGELAVITDRGFSAPERRVIGTGNVGQSIASSYQPAFGGVVGDLDAETQERLALAQVHRVGGAVLGRGHAGPCREQEGRGKG
jgi:hypothetical protein